MSGNLNDNNAVQPPLGYAEEPINNIQRVVLNVIEDLKEYGITTGSYRRIENMAVRFYRTKLRGGGNMPSLVSVYANIDFQTRIWSFPSDYIQYTRVAYEHNGVLWTLSLNPNLSMAKMPPTCDSIENANENEMIGGYWFAPFWGTTRVPYASGGGFNVNYYRVGENFIQFYDSLPPGRAVIEYLSAGKAVNGNTLVPIVYEYAFDRYLKWQICELDPQYVKLSTMFRQEYDGALWDANVIRKGKTPREMLDIMYRSSGFKLR